MTVAGAITTPTTEQRQGNAVSRHTNTNARHPTGIAGVADGQTRDDAALARPKATPGPFEGAAGSRKRRVSRAVPVVVRSCPVVLVRALCVGIALLTAAEPASSQQPSPGTAQADAQVIDDLVKANHILAKEGNCSPLFTPIRR
jgi:hypothetical protein